MRRHKASSSGLVRPHREPVQAPTATLKNIYRSSGRLHSSYTTIPLQQSEQQLNSTPQHFASSVFEQDDSTEDLLYETAEAEATDQRAISSWIPYRDEYLDELLWHDGCGDIRSCSLCEANNAPFKCRDCTGSLLFCRECLLHHHRILPLHRVLVVFRSFYHT